jgi:serine/threonine-protein kinase
MSVSLGDVLLERYVVERKLGEGGMGQVYLGRHVLLGMPAALKVLAGTAIPGMAQRFEREAKLMARVRHPNVVSILDYGFLSDGSPCIAMEYAEGDTLDKWLGQRGALPWETAVQLSTGLLGGLDAMHSAGVLHRDLKPSNIVVTSGQKKQARIIDFGIALPTGGADERLTQTGAIIGTPAYMSPEQLLGYPMDESTDIYAMGLILYEMLAGRPPFPVKDLSGVMRRLREPIPPPVPTPPLPAVPAPIHAALLTALVVEKEGRVRTAEDFSARLAAAAHAARTHPQRADAGIPAAPRPRPAPDPGAEPFATAATAFQPSPRETLGLAETLLQDAPAGRGLTKAQFGLQPTVLAGPQGLAPTGSGGPGESSPAGRAEPLGRFLVAARILPSRLALPAERQFLAGLAGPEARAYILGRTIWFTVQGPAKPRSQAEKRAAEIASGLQERYGTTVTVASDVVAEGFALAASALTGASPMPAELSSLIEKLSSGS